MNHLAMPLSDTPAAAKGLGWKVWWRSLLKPARVLVLPGAGSSPDPQLAPQELPVPAFDAALLAWRDWCQRHAGQRCKVALSSAWTMTGLVPDHELGQSTAGVPSSTQAMSHMAQQWDHHLGMGTSVLARDWLVRATRVQGGWLVCATPRQLVDDLHMLAQRHRVQVVWMGPWWTQVLQRWARRLPAPMLHIQEPGWCLHVVSEAGRGLTRLWAEPAFDAGTSAGAQVVALQRHGAAASACIWDDAATQDLIDGKASAWSGQGVAP